MSAKSNPAPRERGILFKAPLVRAILAGTKTVTRRLVGPEVEQEWRFIDDVKTWPPSWDGKASPNYTGWAVKYPHLDIWLPRDCPHGKPGDRLWVREAWANVNGGAFYRADGEWPAAYGKPPKWKPGIHMFRWASRIDLEITSVRVERLRDISEQDAVAEGVGAFGQATIKSERFCQTMPGAVFQFATLWEEINGSRASWASNPLVWRVEFRRVRP